MLSEEEILNTLNDSELFSEVSVEFDNNKYLIKVKEFPTINKLSFINNERLNDDELELIIDTEELKQNVKEIYINLDELTLEDEDLGEIEELEIVDETQRRFGIDNQADDLLDELLGNKLSVFQSIYNVPEIIIRNKIDLREGT